MRALSLLLIVASVGSWSIAEPVTSFTQIVRSTYRIHGPGSNATCWIVDVADSEDASPDRILVTAAHVLEEMKHETATLQLRVPDASGQIVRDEQALTIRQDDRAIWTKHPEQDIAVLPLPSSVAVHCQSIPLASLADENSFREISTGDLVRCVGYPHAAHFDPIKEGFPLVRLGCIASFPLAPVASHATFLVDFNTFEGDSGGSIAIQTETDSGTEIKLIGIVHGQHFIDEKFDLIYQKGQIRKRLGLSIIIHSQLVRDTIQQHLSESRSKAAE